MCSIFSLFLLLKATLFFSIGAEKISPELKAKIEKGGTANIFISFRSTAPTLAAAKKRSGGTPGEKAKLVFDSLSNLANADQGGIFNMLQTQRSSSSSSPQMKFEKIWISNRLYVANANFELVNQIASSPNVTHITEEATSTIDDTVVEPRNTGTGPDNGPADYTYGLKIIQAPEAWQVLGGAEKAGEGVIVGIADTGCNVEHEALKDNFIGGDYGYFAPNKDAEMENFNVVAHGTHVTGTAVGKKGIGVAPAAKHVQCQGCLNWKCSEYGLEKCLQFFICPTKADGSEPDCSKRVHVINMSLQNLRGTLDKAIDAANAAGIILVSISGNSGPFCLTHTLPGLFDNVISTGNTDHLDNLSFSSGLGPNWMKGDHFKPDVVGPGSYVLSANHNPTEFKYILMSGTSMAAPHLTGLVALLLTRDKTLTQEQVRELIIQNTDKNLTSQYGKWCDGSNVPEGTFPNSIFGYGRFNALKAINAQTAMLAGRK